MPGTARTIVSATLLAGTLDILFAFISSAGGPASLLRSVASGPFGAGMLDGGSIAALIGLAVHFAIMAIMVTLFVLVTGARREWLKRPLRSGVAYGLILYAVMYWIVLPLRWPTVFPMTDATEVAKALFAHIILVGIPIALVAARLAPRRADG